MRISDWSSDVCSSDLLDMAAQARPGSAEILIEKAYAEAWKLWADGEPLTSIETLRSQVMLARDTDPYDARAWLLLGILDTWPGRHDSAAAPMPEARSEERRVGKGCGRTCRSRGSPDHSKKKTINKK